MVCSQYIYTNFFKLIQDQRLYVRISFTCIGVTISLFGAAVNLTEGENTNSSASLHLSMVAERAVPVMLTVNPISTFSGKYVVMFCKLAFNTMLS